MAGGEKKEPSRSRKNEGLTGDNIAQFAQAGAA
jgi:hypothetical protein